MDHGRRTVRQFIICQSAATKERGVNPGSAFGAALSIIDAAVRLARENAVADGFAEPRVGNTAGPTAYTLALSWNLQFVSVIEAPGAPMKSVPASWCVPPRGSCQKPRPLASGAG